MAEYTDRLEHEVRLERMRPEEIAGAIGRNPAVYVPFGSLEWHGRHNAVGLDALKAHEQLVGLAQRVGGVVHPAVYFGSGGGHADFPYSYMVPPDAMRAIVTGLLDGLERDGFGKILLLSGHYPNSDQFLAAASADHKAAGGTAEVLVLVENEVNGVCGDHAAACETSFMMYLYPELVDMAALAGRDEDIVRSADKRMSWMGDEYRGHPCYGIAGVDPRHHASAERGRLNTERLLDFLEKWVGGAGNP